MRKKTEKSGNTTGRLAIPGLEGISSSVDLADSRQKRKGYSVDPYWIELGTNTYPANVDGRA